MEQHKFRYLKLLLKRRKESSVDNYVIALRSLQEKACKCYAEVIVLSLDDFVQMLLLDGCFIIVLIRKYGLDELRERDDTLFQCKQVARQLRHDLMLAENQVPFFVLGQLFSMAKLGDPDDHFLYLIHLFTDDVSPWPDASEIIANKPARTEELKVVALNSASELQEAGIKFEKDTESNFLDIKFFEGVLQVPGFDVSDETGSILRNLITYEDFLVDNHPKYVTDCAFFLHCLINSSKDVEILRRHGIITHLLGDDETVYCMFNRLGKNIVMSSDFCYNDFYDELNGHCGHQTNRWMANLRRNYFNSPWSIISFVAALMLLLFTLAQTVFSVKM